MEFTGYSAKNREEMMQGIFNQDQLELINNKIHKSVFFMHAFTELVKARRDNDTFEDLLALNVNTKH